MTLTKVAKLESGHTPSRDKPDYWGGDIPWLSLADTDALEALEVDQTSECVTSKGIANSSARVLPEDTVVFSRTATVGKATRMKRPMATSQDFANWICGPTLLPAYLVQVFRHMGREWERLQEGVARTKQSTCRCSRNSKFCSRQKSNSRRSLRLERRLTVVLPVSRGPWRCWFTIAPPSLKNSSPVACAFPRASSCAIVTRRGKPHEPATDQLEREWVEEPAADLLRVLFDYKALSSEEVRRLREGLSTEPVLTLRLAECLSRLNPWLGEDSLRRAVAAVTRIAAVDVMEANENAHTALSYGVTAPYTENGRRQDRTVRFFDFDDPSANTFEFGGKCPIKGPRQDIIPDIIADSERVPARGDRVQVAGAGRSNGRGHPAVSPV